MSSTARNFDILATSLSVLHNYFNGSIKLFSDLTKFLDTIIFRYSAKPFHVEFIRHILLSLVYKNIRFVFEFVFEFLWYCVCRVRQKMLL